MKKILNALLLVAVICLLPALPTQAADLENTLYLDLEYSVQKQTNTNWTISTPNSDFMSLEELQVTGDLVPNVTGMGVRDAVYMLESMGIKTQIIGKGIVSSQSIRAGTKIVNGMKIILSLSS